MRLQLCIVLAIVAYVSAIPIDNGVEGDPEISCGPTSITINFNTRNNWEGKLYVKEQFTKGAPCIVNGQGNGRLGSIELGFNECGVTRERSLEPRGVYVYVTVIMSFHPVFITKVDRAVRAQCFYMEADKTVSTEIEVSPLTTSLATFNVPMPVCHYTIRETEDAESPLVNFALVGQAVWHHWHCETDYQDTFCSYPYSCKVSDGQQDEILLLNEDGCAQDKFLLGNVEYPADLWAVKESHVFKYADRAQLYFDCQMRVTIKEPGQECPRPQCGPEPGVRAGARPAAQSQRAPARSQPPRRGRRSVEEGFVADVSIPKPIMVADIDFVSNESQQLTQATQVISADYCFSLASLTLPALLLVVLIGAAACVVAKITKRK